ncbi:MAG: DNA polymerase I [Muribaculaceae bacterium]|nr:DNA polymerase I [Muribaculaceae bacterium]
MEEKRLFLLDAYALIFRAYYALIKVPRLTRDGFNTSAVFGFVNTLEEVLRKEKPSHIAVCFDPPGPTFRSEAYEEYKGERDATPEDIKLSVPIIKEIIRAYNIPVVEVEGFEADDVIGTLARKAEKEGFTTYMMTPDKDFGQLVSPTVLQYKPAYRGQDFELRGEEEVKQRYGLNSTAQVIDLLALMGDKIDNIPGCPGVGEKTAVKLIAEYGSVENLLASTDSLKGALKKKIEENSKQILFSKYLATIRTDVPVDLEPESLRLKSPDREKLFAIFDSLEFRTLAERVRRRLDSATSDSTRNRGRGNGNPAQLSLFDFEGGETAVPTGNEAVEEKRSLSEFPHDFKIADKEEVLREMNDALAGSEECGIASLGYGENDMGRHYEAFAVALEDGRGWMIPADNKEGLAMLLDLMARPDIRKVTLHAKEDMVMAYNLRGERDIRVERMFANFFDVALAHYLLEPEMRHQPALMALSILNYTTLPPLPLPKKGSVPPTREEVRDSLCEEALTVVRLREPLEKAVKDFDQWNLLTDLEFPLSSVLAKMEITGVRIDEQVLNEAAREMEMKISEIEKEIFDLAGVEFNVGSPAKVGEILFDRLRLDEKAKKTKTGQYSTSEVQLEKIAHKNPIVGKILDYRRLKKLLSTYLTALPEAVNPLTGKIHTNYNQTVTATGRISSSNPNLQNIPVREEMGREIRRAFIPDAGHLFLSADYSQIELRLVADLANDETMLEAFNNNADIHAITAAKIYHKKEGEVTAEERRHAKTANFGILYGITAFGLASRLSIPRGEAKELIDNYFATFPTIRKYMSDSVESARENKYAETQRGRRRRLPDINSANPVVRGFAERNAVNAPIQGTAADIIKQAMIDIDREMTHLNLKSRMIMQVHDELNFDVVPEELPRMQELVERLMEKAYSGRVRLTATAGVADNWLDAH